MTKDEIIALIKQTCGFRLDKDTEISAMIDLAQTNLENEPIKPWFMLSEFATINTVVGENRVRVPDDFLLEYDDGALYYIPGGDDDDVPLIKDDYDVLKKEMIRNGELTGPPQAYSLSGDYFIIVPTPDDAYLLKMKYYKQIAKMVAGTEENAWAKWFPLLLAAEAGKLISPAFRDAGATQTFNGWGGQGRAQVLVMNEARDVANRDMQVGGPE